jgi:transposase
LEPPCVAGKEAKHVEQFLLLRCPRQPLQKETIMELVHTHCAGLDVHKKTVVACRITPDANARPQRQTRTFATMTRDLLALTDGLHEAQITHVAMESTGTYSKPIYNVLEGQFELLVVNAQHVKAVPGRKTDVREAEWIADLLQHGLLRPSFVPPPAQRELHELTRARSPFVRERATLINRVHKVLETANLKLGSVATNVLGVSGRRMLDALVAGQTDPSLLAALAAGRLQTKRADLELALEGRLQAAQRLILEQLLVQIDSLEASIVRFDTAIEQATLPFAEAVEHLDTIPGVARATAEVSVSEVGTDMTRFPTPGHLASWAGVCPGNRESAGKRLSGRTRPGNQALRWALVQAAWAAARTRNTYLSAQYHRLAARRGRNRALLAVAHSILIIVSRLLERREDYQDIGTNSFDERSKDATTLRLVSRLKQPDCPCGSVPIFYRATTLRLVSRLKQLGYEVALSSKTAEQAA